MNLNSSESKIIPKVNYRDLIIFLVPLVIFSLYLFAYKPGILTFDSFNQLHQIATGKFTTSHPIFHTFLVMICLKIFKSPFYFGLFQIITFSTMWMVICKYHRDDSVKNSKAFLAQFIITLIICFIPINAVYSITLSSYTLFSYSLMFLCFLIKVMVDKNGQIDTKFAIILALSLAVMSGLNGYGIFIAVPLFIAIIYYLFERNNSENTFVMLIGLTILCIFLIGSLNFVYDVHKDNSHIESIDAFDGDINISAAQNQFFSAIESEPSENYEMVSSNNGGNNLIDSFVDFWRENFILSWLFDNPLLCMVLSTILLLLVYIRTDMKEILYLYLPTLLYAIIVIFTGQNNMYSLILTLYLVMIIFVGFYFNQNIKTEPVSNRNQPIKRPEKIQSQPKVAAEENPENDGYYSNLEYEIEELTLDDINEMLIELQSEDDMEIKKTTSQGKPDLIDDILKEIEDEKR